MAREAERRAGRMARHGPDYALIAVLAVLLVIGLIGYHLYCGRLMRELAAGRSTKSHMWFRWFNEIPVLILFAVVFLVELQPF